jgi:protein-disulfide isomerase
MTTRLIRLAALAAAALLSIGAGKPAAPRGNWLAAISVMPGGSHALGNPNAPVKLVEYISYTCSHCAHFQEQAELPLRLAYVQPGKVQVEVRHLIRDPVDMTVALLTNCGPPASFFANHNLMLRSQKSWIAVLEKASAAQKARWVTGANLARMRAIAADLGFYALMARRGYDRPTLDRCLADLGTANRIAAQTVEAGKAGVTGTPAFLLNGALLAGTYDWPGLDAQLQARF